MIAYYTILIVLGILCVVNMLTMLGRRLDDISAWPLPLFSFFYFIVHSALPIYKTSQTFYRYQSAYDTSSLVISAIRSFVFLVVLTASFHFLLPRQRGRIYLLPKTTNLPVKSIVSIYFVAFAAMCFDVWNIIGMGGFDVYRMDRIAVSNDLGAYRLFATASILALGLMSRCYYINKTRGNLFILIIMFLISGLYYYLINSRNSIFLMICFSLFMAMSASSQRLKIDRKILQNAISIFLVAAFAFLVISSATSARYSLVDSAYFRTRLNNQIAYMFDGAFGNNEASVWMEQHGYRPAWGMTYLAGLVSLIPRSLWPEKPTGGGPYLVNTISPGSYVVGAKGQSSLTTGALVESELNFGTAGIFIIPLLWAIIARLSIDTMRKGINRSGREPPFPKMPQSYSSKCLSFAWVLWIFFLSTSFVYSEFLGFFARAIISVIPLLILSWWPTHKYSGSRRGPR